MDRRDFLKASIGTAALWPAHSLLSAESAAIYVEARTLAGDSIALKAADLKDLAAAMRGQVLLDGQQGYDQARRVWNAMFDRRPALIARCASPSDVMRAVTFASERKLLTAVRAGGHSLSGKSTCDGGIVIDVSPMQSVRVDPQTRIARVEGGALLAHLDRECKAHSLGTTAGTVSHTGAAGLTLGGGFGRLARRYGLACDNVRSIDLVTADGRLVTASEREHRDLLWALRGGGGNFGVATSFEYQLHPMNPLVYGGVIAWPFDRAREVLSFYADFAARAPDELNLDVLGIWSPQGEPLIALEACWSADHGKGEQVLKPVRALGRPVFDQIAAMPYLKLQTSTDAPLAAGSRYYSKSGFFNGMTPPIIDALVNAFGNAEPRSMVFLMQHSGGAVGRVPVASTAFPNRSARHWLMLSSSWKDPSLDAAKFAAVRAAWKNIEPLTSGLYVNVMAEEEHSRVASNYGANYRRLREIKRKYDPANQFRLNANIEPAA